MLKLAAALILLCSAAQAATCGPDAAPAQAAAVGYTCETFRWGPGDDLSGVGVGTNAPGYKLYAKNVPAILSMNAGRLRFQVTPNNPGGGYSLVTCRGTEGTGEDWIKGLGFTATGGYYIESALVFDATGYNPGNGSAGSYGITKEYYDSGGGGGGFGYEVDDTDGCCGDRAGRSSASWTGSAQTLNYNTGTTHTWFATVETGHRFGLLLTSTALTWWYDDVADGSSGIPAGYAAGLMSHHMCWGFMGMPTFPIDVVSLKVWQAPSDLPGRARLFR